MHHSSRGNPCPICFRDKDDKCRWNDHAILCFFGGSFHPPEHLHRGDTIIVGEEKWKLSRLDAGFAGNSYLFVRSNDLHLLSPLQRQRKIKETVRQQIDIRSEFSEIRNLVFISISTPCFESLTYSDFVKYKNITHKAIDKCEHMLSIISINRSRIVLKKFTVVALQYWRKRLVYHLKDFLLFEINSYGGVALAALASHNLVMESLRRR